jgi:hypothetical protein
MTEAPDFVEFSSAETDGASGTAGNQKGLRAI